MNEPKKTFESTEGMSDSCKSALHDVILACADTKLLLGYHYGEWTFGPPEIEAAIACCSLCQSELGHVRLLHAILNTHYDEDTDGLVEARQPDAFANISYLDDAISDWPHFVAANYVVDLAVTSLLFSMKGSSFKPLHMSLEKMLQEERYHIHHGQGWFRTLAARSKETKAAVEASAKTALLKVVEWFGPPHAEGDEQLVEAGIKAESDQAVLSKLLNELNTLSATLQLDLGIQKSNGSECTFPHSLDWTNWNPATRRVSKSGPNEQILYHLRGSKNKVFKLS